MYELNHEDELHDALERYEADRHFVRDLLGEVEEKLLPIQGALGEWRLKRIALFSELLDLFNREDANGLRLVVFGAFSSGKSALINALLGQRLVATGNLATTAVITEIRYGSADLPEPLLITYKEEREILQEIQELLQEEWDILSTLDRPLESNDPLTEGSLDRLLDLFKDASSLTQANLDQLAAYLEQHRHAPLGMEARQLTRWNNRRQYLHHIAHSIAGHARGSLLERLGKSAYAPLLELTHLTSDKHETFAIRSVRIAVPLDFLRGNVIIVDTPGLGSLYERHTEVSEGFVRSADVVLYVMTDRGVGEHDIKFIDMLAKRNRILNEDKVIYAVNMIDNVVREGETEAEIDAEIATHLDRIRQDLKRHGIQQPRLYAVSAECALYSLAALRGQPLSNKEKRLFRKMAIYFPDQADVPDPVINLRLSGIQTLRTALRTYLIENTGRLLRERTCSRIGMALNSVYEEIGEKEVAMQLTEKQWLVDLENWGREKEEVRRMERAAWYEIADTFREKGYARASGLVEELLSSLLRQLPENLYLATRKRRLLHALRYSLEKPVFAARNWFAETFDRGAMHKPLETGLEARFARAAQKSIREVVDQISFKERYEAITHELKASVEQVSRQKLRDIDDRIRGCKDASGLGPIMQGKGLADDPGYHRPFIPSQDIDLSLTLKGLALGGAIIGASGLAGFMITVPVDPIVSPIAGILSMLIVGSIVELSRDEEEVKDRLRQQVAQVIEERRPAMVENALSPLREYEAQMNRLFSLKIAERIEGFDEVLMNARNTLHRTREENEAKRAQLEQACIILVDAGSRCQTRLLPEAAAFG
jgi:GTPase SAR1 family protein